MTAKKDACFVLDLETTSRHKGKLFAGTPHDALNDLVLASTKPLNAEAKIASTHQLPFSLGVQVYNMMEAPSRDSFYKTLIRAAGDNDTLTIVGVNVGFDISYIMVKYPSLWEIIAPKVRLFDVSMAMNFLTGRKHKELSMDAMAEFFGLPLKPDKIAAYWAAGMDTTDIPMEELYDYAVHDATVTHSLYERLVRSEMNTAYGNPIPNSSIWKVKMDDLLATTQMECHGMRFDSEKANEIGMDMVPTLQGYELSLVSTVHSYLGRDVGFNPSSNKQVADFLYGGTFEIEVQQPILDATGTPSVFKTGTKKGQPRTKKAVIEVHHATTWTGYLTSRYSAEESMRSTDDERLQDMVASSGITGTVAAWVSTLIEWRTLNKDLNTYFLGYPEYTVGNGHFIHTSFSHTSTATGRLSSSKPNVQNASSAD